MAAMTEKPEKPEKPEKRKWDQMDAPERKRLLDWIVEACLLYGSLESTAYRVAGEVAKGLGS